jgi:hypothetical protein
MALSAFRSLAMSAIIFKNNEAQLRLYCNKNL